MRLSQLTYRSAVLARDGLACSYCSIQLTRETATVDHVQPLMTRGRNHPDNMVVACFACNNKKGALTLTAFLLGDPSPERETPAPEKMDAEAPATFICAGMTYRKKPRPFAEPRQMTQPSLHVPLAEMTALGALCSAGVAQG